MSRCVSEYFVEIGLVADVSGFVPSLHTGLTSHWS